MAVTDKKVEYGTYAAAYALCVIFSKAGYVYLAGALLMAEAVFLYILNVRTSGSLVSLKGLFSLSWVGGEGLACLKLSRLQGDWSNITWLCFFLVFVCFCTGYEIFERKAGRSKKAVCTSRSEKQAGRIKCCILFLAVCSVLCFCLEAVVVGFIPLFSPEPHAYSYFHISGVHYFTISCILIPALTVVYVKIAEIWTSSRIIVLAVCNVIAVAIPILCVSRFQLLFAVGFAAVTYLMLYQKITWKMIVTLLLVMIPMYVLLTLARRHDVSYLNGIFEMKYEDMPIFITQPYMYVANNYENFNCMVQQLTEHSYGIRMLFPFFALTGLKFVFPELFALPLFITKTELTTLTMFYDAYYDFGIAGIIVIALVIGIAAAFLMSSVRKGGNPVVFLFYGQFAIYMSLSFFTTWFSNPTTWFWLALTVMMYIFVGYEGNSEGKFEWKKK